MYRNVAYLQTQQKMRLFTWDSTGKRISYDTTFEPYIYLETSGAPDATSIFNTNLKKRSFRNQHERYKYLQDSEITRVFENLPAPQQFLVDTFCNQNDTAAFSQFPIKLWFLDIETYSPGAFPVAEKAADPIIVITVYDSLTEKFTTWGTKPCSKKFDSGIFISCISEKEMLNKFIDFVDKDAPDILSGWNSEFFDVPYLINRITNMLGETAVKRLSPVGRIYSRVVHDKFGKDATRWFIEGIACIDYMEIYKKFCQSMRESYKLNSIAELEIGETKVDYGDQNLTSLADSDWDTFVEYNIQDVVLLVKMEKKLRYLELLRMIAYAGCTTFEGALGTLSVVNGLCAIKARSKNLRIPTFNRDGSGQKNEGAYVGEPTPGFQEHVISFDANSLYPNTMITLNISPETKIGKFVTDEKGNIVVHHVNGQSFELTPELFNAFVEKESLAISKANVLFTQKTKGIVPEIVDGFYKKRVEIQDRLEKFERAITKLTKGTDDYNKIKKELDYLNIKQHTIKIIINSVYGYFGNKRAPLGDDDIARSITLTGQAVIKQANEIIRQFIKTKLPAETNIQEAVVYNDTDSLYISVKQLVTSLKIPLIQNGIIPKEYYDLVAEFGTALNTGIKAWGMSELKSTDCRFIFKREVIVDTGLFLQKKRYVIHILDNKGIPCNKFKYTGVEVVRTTMPKAIKPFAKKIIEVMLTTRDQQQVDKVFTEAYETFKQLPIEDVAQVMGISDYNKYANKCEGFKTVKGMTKHVKAAYFHNLLLKRFGVDTKYEAIKTGDKVKFFSVRKPNKFGLSTIGYKYYCPPEFKQTFEVDYELMFEKVLHSVIERFYECVGWKLKNPGLATQTDLFALFG